MTKYMLTPVRDDDDPSGPSIRAQVMCEETMQATQGAILTHAAYFLIKAQAAYSAVPKWKFITRHNMWTEIRGAIKLANHMAEQEIKPCTKER